MDIIMRIHRFFKYWYVRYLLATEMYMVQPWEKAVIYATFAILFGTTWLFNYSIVLSAISHLRGSDVSWKETL